MYSVLYHIIEHHADNIQKISLSFEGIILCGPEADIFWAKLFSLPRLRSLSIDVAGCFNQSKIQYSSNWHLQLK